MNNGQTIETSRLGSDIAIDRKRLETMLEECRQRLWRELFLAANCRAVDTSLPEPIYVDRER